MRSDDTPIIIADGSLTIESSVPWADFSGSGPNTKVHPHNSRPVTNVVIDMAGKPETVTFSGQKCTVAVRYASTDVTVKTGNNGKGLEVTTDYDSFRPGSTPNHLAHIDAGSKISHVTVTGGTPAFDRNVSGSTTVTVGFKERQPD